MAMTPTHLLKMPISFDSLQRAPLRRCVKVLLDLGCGAAAVLVTLAIEGDFAQFSPLMVLRLAGAAGLILVLAHMLGGSYRGMWRYTSFRETAIVATSAAILGLTLWLWRESGGPELSSADLLLVSLLTLFSCLAVRALRR